MTGIEECSDAVEDSTPYPVKARRAATAIAAEEVKPAESAAQIEARTLEESVRIVERALPDDMPTLMRSALLDRLRQQALFFPARLPWIAIHPASKSVEEFLAVVTCPAVVRCRAASRTFVELREGMIATAGGTEFGVCGMLLPHASTATMINAWQDLTGLSDTKEWVAVLFNNLAGVTAEVCLAARRLIAT